jgi:hypothetical protein
MMQVVHLNDIITETFCRRVHVHHGTCEVQLFVYRNGKHFVSNVVYHQFQSDDRTESCEEVVKFPHRDQIHEDTSEELHVMTFTIISHVQTLMKNSRITITEDNMM